MGKSPAGSERRDRFPARRILGSVSVWPFHAAKFARIPTRRLRRDWEFLRIPLRGMPPLAKPIKTSGGGRRRRSPTPHLKRGRGAASLLRLAEPRSLLRRGQIHDLWDVGWQLVCRFGRGEAICPKPRVFKQLTAKGQNRARR